MYEPQVGDFDTPGGHRVHLHFRQGTNDFNTLWSSLNEDEYHLPRDLEGTALDVGGYLGSVGIALALDNPGLRVVIVEPVPPNCDLIERNISVNGVGEQVSLIRGAVGRRHEKVDVWYGYRGNEPAEHHAFVGNSTLAYDDGGMVPHEQVTYKATSLVDLVGEYGPLTFMKVDIEGGEWAFLDSSALPKVHTIVGEWHPVRQKTQADLYALFEPTHALMVTGPEGGPGGFRAIVK